MRTSRALQPQISYTDAIGLMNAHAAQRQTAMYSTGGALTPPNPRAAAVSGAVFAPPMRISFAMFEVPFRFGGPWSAADDAGRADVVVIARKLNDKVFGGANSVGKTVNLDDHDYRVVGVTDRWEPMPKFYDLNNGKYGKSEDMFMPFTRAIEEQMPTWGNNNCSAKRAMRAGRVSCIPNASGSSTGSNCPQPRTPRATGLS